MVENQAMIMQGSSTVCVSAPYSKVREVLVPVTENQKDVISEVRRVIHQPSGMCSVGVQHPLSLPTPASGQEPWRWRRGMCSVGHNILVLSNREDPARVVHFSGGQLVAVGSKDRLVRLLDVRAMRERSLAMQGHAGSVRAVHLCEDRGLVVSAGYDLSIRCWNLRTGACTMLLRGHFGTINCLDLHGNTLVSGAKDCRVKVWDLLTGRCHRRLRFRHDSPVQCVRVGLGLVLSSCDRGLLKLWDMEAGSLLKQIDTPQGSVKCLYLDQWHALSGGADGYVMAWSTRSDHAQSLMTYRHPREVLTLTFLFLRVITGCADGKIRVFDFLSGDCLRVIISNSQQSAVLSLHIHDNNIVINTSTSVMLFQFGRDGGGHSEPSEGERVDKAARDSPRGSEFRGYPYSPVRAQARRTDGLLQSEDVP
ncbi:hypothetical protein AAFF_G00100770 [Aldrovandia affinis]|uniref:F-box and WD repeat domain containing 10 n=1 Tax=Aldrovandia affinis TaxID=143900 RepID=A0AAD7RUV5_9TELE|nr:hypothetical protein AAFF_G00100770 [Aldrovandia affinis]